MIDITIKKTELGLFQAEATLNCPPLTVVRHKADRDDLEYEIRRAFSDLVEEIVAKHIKDEF